MKYYLDADSAYAYRIHPRDSSERLPSGEVHVHTEDELRARDERIIAECWRHLFDMRPADEIIDAILAAAEGDQ